MFYFNSNMINGLVNDGVKLVAIPNVTTPIPQINTNLNPDNNISGVTMNSVNTIGVRLLTIAKNNPNRMICIVNSAVSNDIGYFSTNGGFNWNRIPYFDRYVWNSAISDDGNALFTTRTTSTSTIYYSYNQGTTWSSKSPYTNTAAARGLSCSSDGSIVFMGSLNSFTCSISTNSCVSFIQKTTPFYCMGGCMTSNGSRIWIGKYNDNNGNIILAYSDNLGSSWNIKTVANVGGTSVSSNVYCSSDGKYVLVTNGTSLFISNDYGVNFLQKTIPEVIFVYGISISKTGRYIALSSNTTFGNVLYSKDFGNTWSTISFPNQTSYMYAVGIEQIHT